MTTQKKWTREFLPKDDALHPCSVPGAWEWWYFDADFENGYTIAGTFHLGSPRPPANSDVRFIEIAMYDPQGNRRMVRKRYPKEQCSFSEEVCDVVIGPNYMRGQIPTYHIYMAEGDQGFDLTYESMVEGHIPEREPVPGETLGVPAYPPGTPPGWVVPVTRAKVTGKLTWDGKTMNVAGEGYHDHNFASGPISEAGGAEHTFWGRLHMGKWTLNWIGGRMLRRNRYLPTGSVICFKGEKIVAITNKGGGIGSNFTTEETGIEWPQTIRVTYDDPGLVEGTLDFKVTKRIEFMDLHSRFKPFQRWYAETFVGRPAYFRYRFNYDANLTIVGEKVSIKGASWMEHHKIV